MKDFEHSGGAAVPGVAIADGLEALSAIREPGCAAALWPRQTSPDFQAWIDELAPEALPKMRQIVRPDAAADAVAAVCEARGTPAGAERSALIDDVATLAAGFAEIVRAPYLRIRLDVVTNNACRKFHIDAVSARLICTFRGTGTQYGVSRDGAEPTEVFTTPTGAPLILRGTLWPEDPPSGLRHRSPPIAGTGETRLLLVLDPIHDPDEDGD